MNQEMVERARQQLHDAWGENNLDVKRHLLIVWVATYAGTLLDFAEVAETFMCRWPKIKSVLGGANLTGTMALGDDFYKAIFGDGGK